ncbi:MAG: tRNA dihydrouridine synthase DusB [Candidatus Omnitrophota bacterium]
MLTIGSLKLNSPVLLAPLAGISDSSFRLICRQFGAGFTFVEMINARALSFKNKKTKKMLNCDPLDKPIGIQLLSAELPYVLKALEVLERFDFDLLDFNAACPVKKVCRRGEGAALAKDPEKFEQLLQEIVRRWSKPVTVKIRSGWDSSNLNALDMARRAEQAGCQAVFIHGRHRNQFYKGTVDYAIIAAAKKSVRIPVIASGDIFSATSAKTMFDETGCDGILVARGALGNPWIFPEIKAGLKNSSLPPPPCVNDIKETLRKHLDLSIAEHGENNAIKIMRKYVGWYFKGHPFVRPLRQKATGVKTKNEFLVLIEGIPVCYNCATTRAEIH